MSEYQDQYAIAMSFLIRFEARQATTLTLFLEQLPAEQRTPTRAAGLQQARSGAAQTITGAITAMTEGMKPGNTRLIAVALRDTRDIWAAISCRTTAARIAKLIADTPATVKDRETQKNLTAFAGALAAAKEADGDQAMNLQAMLAARVAAGKPVRVGLIGAGKFGSMFLAQVPSIAGLEVAVIADLIPSAPRRRAATSAGTTPASRARVSPSAAATPSTTTASKW